MKDVKSRVNKSRYLNNIALSIREGKLLICERKIDEILKDYSTPLYIFSEDQIRENCRNLKNMLKKHFKKFCIYYSYKTNYLDDVCRIVSEEGLGAEVVSLGELSRARKWAPNNIIFSGIYKPDYILRYLVRNKVNFIAISSLNEFLRVNKYFADINEIQPIAIRIKSKGFGGFSGIEYTDENFNKILDLLSKSENLRFEMLHYHAGTQILKNTTRIKHLEFILNIMQKFEEFGYSIPRLNLGGGFPEAGIIPHSELEKYFTYLKVRLNENFNDLEIIFEPGRYIVGNTGFLLTKIEDYLTISNENWVLVDAGDHILPKASKSNFRFVFSDKMDQPHKNKVSIKGCLPTDIDILAKNYPAPSNIQRGDIIVVANAGAYVLTWSYKFSFPSPAVLLMNKIYIKELIPEGNKFDLHY